MSSASSLRVVLLEDEPPALAHLTSVLRQARADVDIAASFDTVAGARAWFAAHSAPDLVVSDIQLADGLSLSLFADGAVSAPVVFTTAYDEYVFDAFRCASIDYLLKPIAAADVARALDKLERMRGALRPADAAAVADAVRAPRQRLLVRRGPDLRALRVDEIAYLVADEKLTVVVTRSGAQHVVDKTLSDLECELDGRAFFRANRGVIVHVDAVKSFRSAGKGRIALTLEPRPDDDVIVPQAHAAAFRAFIDR